MARLHLAALVLLAAAASASAAPPAAPANATATPDRLSIEWGGDVTIVGLRGSAAGAASSSATSGAETCTLTRHYGSGGYGLTHEKLGPSFKHCCEVTAPATRLNASAVVCHIPGGLATEGNTSVALSDGSFAYLRHYAAFVPEFSRRPYFRESEGAVLVRVPRALATPQRALTLSATLPCGGPPLRATLQGQELSALAHFAVYRLRFPLAQLSPTCFEEVALTLSGAGLTPVTRNRTFVRAPPPRPGAATTAWSVDHESRALLADGRRVAAQGWFAGSYAHESVGLPPMTRVPPGETMHMNEVRKLGQSSMITEWGRQGHTFTRYGVGAAADIDGKPQTATLLASLDAAAAAGVGVLINIGVDKLAQAMIGCKLHDSS